MPRRRIYDQEKHAQFVTFSRYRRRRMLDCEPLRNALVELLTPKLTEYCGICSGYVVMPDHVHRIVWFEQPGGDQQVYEELEAGDTDNHANKIFHEAALTAHGCRCYP